MPTFTISMTPHQVIRLHAFTSSSTSSSTISLPSDTVFHTVLQLNPLEGRDAN